MTAVVALVGRQNSGKTSILMHLAGGSHRPVNFPGTSVERVTSRMRVDGVDVEVVDLPGVGSLTAVSRDEQVTLDFLRGDDRPDVVCAVLDGSKLSVELHLLDKLLGLGVPIVVALSKVDVADNEGAAVDVAALRAQLPVPVFEVNGRNGAGIAALREALGRPVVLPRSDALPVPPDQLAETVAARRDGARASLTDRLDGVLLHRFWGLPLLLLCMFGIFQAIFVGADPFMGLIESGQGGLADLVAGAVGPGALQSFLVDGLINGMGSVLIFIPQIAMLMGIVAFLEGTGYMARAAFLLDRVLGRFGLTGRSFVPLVSSFACAVPGVLAARIIDDERDRIATIAVAPLMTCSARLPVYVLLISAFFPVKYAGLALLGMYLLGIIVAVLVALALRRTVLKGPRSLFMLELPTYQWPSARVVFGQVTEALRAFIVLAGTVIFALTMVVWLLSYYPRPEAIAENYAPQAAAAEVLPEGPERAAAVEAVDQQMAQAYLEQSYLARIGKAVQPLFEPAGFDWRTTVGLLAAFPARELIIPTLGTLYSAGEVDPGSYEIGSLGEVAPSDGLRARLRTTLREDGRRSHTPLTALALMVFFALCAQCVGTLAVIKKETRSWRWPLFTFAYMTALAWLGAVLVNQVGLALGYG